MLHTLCAALPEPRTNVLVKAGCLWPPPMARKGEKDSQGMLPKAWQNRLRWRRKKRGKGEREEKIRGRKTAEE